MEGYDIIVDANSLAYYALENEVRDMPTLTIPNMPEDLMDIMERRAAANGRAVEDEALIWLQCAGSGRALPGVQPIARKRTPEEAAKILAEVDRVRQNTTMIPAGEAELNRAIASK